KKWGRYPPYRELGYDAVQAATMDFAIGTLGAGTGALTYGLKGGLGSASTVLDSGVTIGALAAVNPTGSVTVGRSRHFWAAPFEIGHEFGGLGYPDPLPQDARKILLKYRDRRVGGHGEAGSTTIAVIATDAVLTKA
ncbi:peptidase T4, partial [Mesorhizobium sp. M2A.F.Ca.ET.042.01.1.1]|uniref:P1 family peptidase n=1 Tax=Mesorhizobium sp. M2A.F.Ca.ET.042.01.1.1 TaxID=2496745 RepID=UPI000FD3B50F